MPPPASGYDAEQQAGLDAELLDEKQYGVYYKKLKWYMRNYLQKVVDWPVTKRGKECKLTLKELQSEPLRGYFVHVALEAGGTERLVGIGRQCKFLEWVLKGCPGSEEGGPRCPHTTKDALVRKSLQPLPLFVVFLGHH